MHDYRKKYFGTRSRPIPSLPACERTAITVKAARSHYTPDRAVASC